jgi:Tfp pilus assembly protein PilF
MKINGLIFTLFLILLTACSTNSVNQDPSPSEKKAVVYYDQGTSELVEKNYQMALTNLLKAKDLDPNDSKIRTNLGMAYYFREQPEFAINELKEAISIDKKNTDAKMNLATIYMERNKLKEAKKLYEEVLTDLTYVALHRVHYNLAILNLKIGDRKSAFEELYKSIKEKEDYCLAHYKLGELYNEEYKYKEALNSFKDSSKGSCVNNPEPHLAMANVLIHLNKKAEAKIKLEYVIEKFNKTNLKIIAERKLKDLDRMSQSNDLEEENELTNAQMTETPKF